MDKTAVDAFKSPNKIALSAGAGLSIVTYSAKGQASWGKGDIIMRSNAAGAYACATVSVTDVNWDDDTSRDYYGRKIDPAEVLAGEINTSRAEQLKQVLPGQAGGRSLRPGGPALPRARPAGTYPGIRLKPGHRHAWRL